MILAVSLCLKLTDCSTNVYLGPLNILKNRVCVYYYWKSFVF